jgi:hypothetical protein
MALVVLPVPLPLKKFFGNFFSEPLWGGVDTSNPS